MGASGHSADNVGTSTAPRHAPKPAATGRRTLHCSDVSLLDGGSDGPAELELDLDIDDDGIRLSRVGAGTVWSPSWTDVSALTTVDDRRLPTGQRGVTLAVTTDDETSRVLALPSRRPGAVAARIRATARRRRVDPDRPDRRAPLPIVLAVVAITGSLVAWLLLAAGHVVGT